MPSEMPPAFKPIVELEPNHPLAIALRRRMKGDFILNLSQVAASKWGWKEADLMIHGSTLMHQLAYIDKVKFPFPGVRVSDIDIAVRPKTGGQDEDFELKSRKHLPPVLRQAVLNGAFDVAYEQTRYDLGYADEEGKLKEIWKRQDIENLDDRHFAKEFYVYRTFAADNALEQIKDFPDYEQILAEVKKDKRIWQDGRMIADVKVRLTVSPNIPNTAINNFGLSFLLPPDPLYPGADAPPEGRLPLYRATAVETIAGKLARLLKSDREFTPKDVHDIYNLTHANPPVVNLDPGSPDNDLDTIRFLIVCDLASSLRTREAWTSDMAKQLLERLQDTQENRAIMRHALEKEVAPHRMKGIDTASDPYMRFGLSAHIGPMLRNAAALLSAVFCEKPLAAGEKMPRHYKPGSLHYTPNEVRFAAMMAGRYDRDSDTIISLPDALPEARRSRWALGSLRARKPREDYVPLPDINITEAVSCLRKEFPKVFAKYPGLEQHIINDPSFIAVKEEEMRRRQKPDVWVGDM